MRPELHARPALLGVLALTAAALLTGCSDEGGGSSDTVASWSAKGGKEHLRVLGEDVRAMVQLSGDTDGSGGGAARCQQVLDHVKAAKAYRALPDEIARSRWEEALGKVETAATSCVQNQGGPKLSEMVDVQSAYSLLARRISELAKSAS